MRAMTGDEIRQGVRGRWRTHTQPIPVRGVSIDSRTANEGDLFVAIRGENHDGHEHLQAASEAGCIAAVIDTQATVEATCLDLFPAGVLSGSRLSHLTCIHPPTPLLCQGGPSGPQVSWHTLKLWCSQTQILSVTWCM